jgi:hypothetical protein
MSFLSRVGTMVNNSSYLIIIGRWEMFTSNDLQNFSDFVDYSLRDNFMTVRMR